MPPKSPKAVTLPVCPDHVFAISHEFTITGRKKLSTNIAHCDHQWVKGSQALVRLGEESGWWRATHVQEYESGTFSVRLAKTGDDTNQFGALSLTNSTQCKMRHFCAWT